LAKASLQHPPSMSRSTRVTPTASGNPEHRSPSAFQHRRRYMTFNARCWRLLRVALLIAMLWLSAK